MKVNFEIEDNYAVQYQNMHIDLHNNFVLEEIRDSSTNIQIEFRKLEGDWIPQNEWNKLIFTFKEVSYRYEENEESKLFNLSDKNLAELFFFPKWRQRGE